MNSFKVMVCSLVFSSVCLSAQQNCFVESSCVKKTTDCRQTGGHTNSAGDYYYLYGFNALMEEKIVCITSSGEQIRTTNLKKELIENDTYIHLQDSAIIVCELNIKDTIELHGACK